MTAYFSVLSDFPIQVFNEISSIYNLSNLGGEIKESVSSSQLFLHERIA